MILLEGATIVTSEKEAEGSILIKDGKIAQVLYSEAEDYGFRVFKAKNAGAETVDCSGLHVMAGGIDAHVHFREPGLTHKADMATESLAAIYGGVTSVMDMPNTNPATVTAEALKGKLDLANSTLQRRKPTPRQHSTSELPTTMQKRSARWCVKATQKPASLQKT